MLNPSTADERTDDPTLRRCIGFARHWGLGGLRVVNLYALRATKPAELWRVADAVGPENDRYLAEAAAGDDLLIAAWGVHAKPERIRQVLALPGFSRLSYLQLTKDGAPRHPLYLCGELSPVRWGAAPVVDSD